MKPSSKNYTYILTEQGTDKYADLSMAQAAVLPLVAQAIVAAIRAGAYNGHFELQEEDEHDGERDEILQSQ